MIADELDDLCERLNCNSPTENVLSCLLDAATDTEESYIREAAARAGLLWMCGACGWWHGEEDTSCGQCGNLAPEDGGMMAGDGHGNTPGS